MKKIISLLFLLLSSQSYAESCNDIIESLPEDYEAKVVEVPLNEKKDSETLRVAYYVPKEYDENKLVLFINGGPAASSGSSIQALAKYNVEKGIPIVFFDQRGTGCSSEVGKNNLNYFSSKYIVKDVEEIRKQLIGDKKWTVVGQSYGGLVSFRYIETAPKGIKKAITSGFVPSESGLEYIKDRTLETDRVFKTFLEKYPKAAADLEYLMEESPEEWCYQNLCGKDGYTILNLFLGFSNYWEGLASAITKAKARVELGDRTYFDWYAKYAYTVYDGGDLYQALSTIEVNVGYDDISLCEELFKQYPEIRGQVTFSDCHTVERIKVDKGKILSVVKNLKDDSLRLDKIRKSIVENPEIKLVHYRGEWDLFSPAETEERFFKHFGKYFERHEVKEKGHDSFLAESLWNNIYSE